MGGKKKKKSTHKNEQLLVSDTALNTWLSMEKTLNAIASTYNGLLFKHSFCILTEFIDRKKDPKCDGTDLKAYKAQQNKLVYSWTLRSGEKTVCVQC